MHGKVVLTPLPTRYKEEVRLKDILQKLRERQKAMKLKPDDAIGATHLLRCIWRLVSFNGITRSPAS